MSNYKNLSDRELIGLIQRADEVAFNTLYDRYAPILYLYACKMTPKSQDADDIIQDIFLSIWNKKNLKIRTSVSSYLYTAVRYRLFDIMDRDNVRISHLESLQRYLEKEHWTVEDYLREKELAIQIEKEINRLPPKMRRIFLMSRKEDQSYQEIARQLQLSDKTIKKQISNALKILRVRLSSLSSLLILILVLILSALS